MDDLKKHEIFEIETLDKLNSGRLLEPLVFGGGTMLRLCYELNRYSVDLDFWFVRQVDEKGYFGKLKNYLEAEYDLTDAKIKYHTLLFELRSPSYPKRLKIEIRKRLKDCDFEDRIAFSPYTTKQVLLKVFTLSQMMENKTGAALERGEIRDFFDIEFLIRQGAFLPDDGQKLKELERRISEFRDKDYKVTLGSLVDAETRKYYIKNKFDYLIRKIQSKEL